MESWLESLAEPRAITALATVPHASGDERRALPQGGLNLMLARSWAEFMDPAMAILSQALAVRNGFAEALLQRVETASGVQQTGQRKTLSGYQLPGLSAGAMTSWRKVDGAGPIRAQGDQPPPSGWLMLPMPHANPWLAGGYRY